MSSYLIGKIIRLGATFEVDSVATDPTTVSLIVQDPDGVDTTYTYPASVSKSATGVYYYDLTLSAAGLYCYRWVGTGAAAAVEEGNIQSAESLVI